VSCRRVTSPNSRSRSPLKDYYRLLEIAPTATTDGFDIAWAPKSKLFSRGKGPRLLGRFVACVDRDAVVDAWARAGTAGGSTDEVCVLLMGAAMAPAGELARAIAEQRRRQRGTTLTLIPVDARNWEAHMPLDAPGIAKTLLARLRTGA